MVKKTKANKKIVSIKKKAKMQQSVLHYPNLKTVLMVEEILEDAKEPMSKKELKDRLPKKIMHQTLNIILEYLEECGKIITGNKGIFWIYNPSEKLAAAIKRGRRVL